VGPIVYPDDDRTGTGTMLGVNAACTLNSTATAGGNTTLTDSASAGWTTLDGAVGDIKMVDTTDLEDALTKNPGWSEFAPMAGKFPIGASTDYGASTEGGRDSISWSAKGTSAAGGSRESPGIGAISIDGTEIASRAQLNNTPTTLDSASFKILPPYRALIFLRKDF
jgi:hypothetical protein